MLTRALGVALLLLASFVSFGSVSAFEQSPSSLLPQISSTVWLPHVVGVSSVGPWTFRAPMSTSRYFLGATSLGGKVYVAGGITVLPGGASQPLNTVEVYDPASHGWQPIAPLAATPPISGSVQMAAAAGNLFVASEAGVQAYDPGAGAWTPLAGMNQPRHPGALVGLNDKVYAIGGSDTSGLLANVEVFDPGTGHWTNLSPLPVPRSSMAAVAAGGKIYALGGNANGQSFSARVDVYNPATNTWQPGVPMPVSRTSHAAVTAADGKIYVFGGAYFSGSETDASRKTVHQYDPTSQTWRACPDLPAPRYGLEAAAVGDKIYAIGGVRLDIASGTYTAYDSLIEGALPVCP